MDAFSCLGLFAEYLFVELVWIKVKIKTNKAAIPKIIAPVRAIPVKLTSICLRHVAKEMERRGLKI